MLPDRYDDLAGKSIELYAARTTGVTINEEADAQPSYPGDRGK